MTAQPAPPPAAPGTRPAGDPPARPVRGARLPRQARRRQLLDAARQVFVAGGYHATGMDEIAVRAGVSKPVLYQHFPSKLDLYLALLDEHAPLLVDRVREALESTQDNQARVTRSITAYFDFVDDPDGAYQLIFESDLRSEPQVRDRVERSFAGCVSAIAETIAGDTSLGEGEAELLSVGLAGLAETGAKWWLSSGRPLPKDRAVGLLADLMWRGLAGSPRWSPDDQVERS